MKFYIGSGLKNCDLVNEYARMLEAQGWTHTYNWAKNLKPAETAGETKPHHSMIIRYLSPSSLILYCPPSSGGI